MAASALAAAPPVRCLSSRSLPARRGAAGTRAVLTRPCNATHLVASTSHCSTLHFTPRGSLPPSLPPSSPAYLLLLCLASCMPACLLLKQCFLPTALLPCWAACPSHPILTSRTLWFSWLNVPLPHHLNRIILSSLPSRFIPFHLTPSLQASSSCLTPSTWTSRPRRGRGTGPGRAGCRPGRPAAARRRTALRCTALHSSARQAGVCGRRKVVPAQRVWRIPFRKPQSALQGRAAGTFQWCGAQSFCVSHATALQFCAVGFH